MSSIRIHRLYKNKIDGKLEELEQIERDSFGKEEALSGKKLKNFLKKQNLIYVAEVDGKVVGYVSGRRIEDKRGEVFSLGVLKEYRRHKIGDQLMKHIHDAMRKLKLKKASLTVDTRWKPARKLYEKRGYQQVKGKKLKRETKELKKIHRKVKLPRKYQVSPKKVKLKEYYPDNGDAYRLEKDLKKKKRKKPVKKKLKFEEKGK